MADEALFENQVTYLYHTSAKALYNLALFSFGDQPLAEQLSANAFVCAFHHLKDKTDVTRFRIKSTRSLYLISKKTLIFHSRKSFPEPDQLEDLEHANDAGKRQIHQLLNGLNYEERFLMLLFLQQKYCEKEIAQILCVPEFMVKKRIYRILKKTKNVWAELTEFFAPDKIRNS